MGSFSVARPTIQPIEQPDLLQNYGRLLQWKGLQQQQAQQAAMAPYQQQALQQQVEAGQMQNQQMHQDMADQQSFRQAMQDPSMRGKTIGQVADTLAQNGRISQKAWAAAKEADLKSQQTLGQLADNSLKTLDTAYKSTQPLYDSVQKMDDATLQANWPTIAQQYDAIWNPVIAANPQLKQNMPMLDPNQPMTKAQLAQFGPMLSMGQAYMDAENKRRQDAADLQKKEADAATSQAKLDWAKQHGTVPGISPDEAGMADFLFKNPTKGPSDYIAWKAKQAPLAQLAIMNATGNGGAPEDVAKKFGMSPVAFDQTAEKYWTTGTLPPVGRGGAAMAFNRAIMNRAAELHPDGSLAANSAEYKANEASLKKFQAFADTTNAFEQTAIKNMNLLQETLKNIPDLGARFANVPARSITGSMIGTENMARFHTALNVAQTEAAKVLNNPNSGAVLSDSARQDLQKIIDGNMPVKAIIASLDTLRQDMNNRTGSNRETIADIQRRLSGASAPNGNNQQPPPTAPMKIRLPSGKEISIE